VSFPQGGEIVLDVHAHRRRNARACKLHRRRDLEHQMVALVSFLADLLQATT